MKPSGTKSRAKERVIVGEEKMKLLYIVYLLLISNTLYASKLSIVKGESRDKISQQEKRTVDALFIYEFEKIRQSAKLMRNINKYKDVYNGLAKRVNTLIDSVVICVKRDNISSKEDKVLRHELHRVFEEIEEINAEISKDENLELFVAEASLLAKTGFNIDINVDKILSWLTKTIDSLSQFFDKRDFIAKLEDKKWKIINR